ncbi:hypothetical protein MJT46_013777 [Ovis ammon polii x Ovis aries]|nr:hypothetical protein MJT46_013777 [Ovis ammon polii x Ovis aries]
MSGNFLSGSKGVKDPLEVPVVRCDYPREASEEMGLISPGGQNLLDFLELRQVLSTYDGDLGTRSGGLRKGQSPCEFLEGLSGYLSRRCWGIRPCVELGPEPEDSSPVLTWILGCSRLTTGTSGTRSGGLRKGQSPCEFLEGLSGHLCRRCRGLRPCVESGPEPEDSSPVLTWILVYIFSLPGEVHSTYDGDLRDRSGGLRKGQSPCEFFGGL